MDRPVSLPPRPTPPRAVIAFEVGTALLAIAILVVSVKGSPL